MTSDHRVAGSFRDPSGFMFMRDGVLLRRVNHIYSADYDLLMDGGLYKELTDAGLMVAHTEVEPGSVDQAGAYKVLQPEQIPLITYPYEWSFGQLKAAALLTLDVMRRALTKGMILKDASAYNVQFHGYRPVMIDTLSFTRYEEGSPWIAYRQFCQHFLAPLALMARRDINLGQLSRLYLDGVPLPLASNLLPGRTRLIPAILAHIHLHARAQGKSGKSKASASAAKKTKLSRRGLEGLLDSLGRGVSGSRWKAVGTEWVEYYSDDSYSSSAFEDKRAIVTSFIETVEPQNMWDLGANTGEFSRIGSERQIYTTSFDIDPAAVERNYSRAVAEQDEYMLPLILDLTNPSGSIGWAESEREGLTQRGPTDLLLALALIHHLTIANGIPLERVAEYFASLSPKLVIEFVPKDDPKVELLLAGREDIFTGYTREGFEKAFSEHYQVDEVRKIKDSKRLLYLMSIVGGI